MTFPELSADEVLAAVAERWDLSGPLPLPRGQWLACPVCRAGRPQLRYWKWHRRTGTSTVRGRCDVSFKCVACSAAWVHGVAVDDEYYRRNATRSGHMVWWRQARRILEGE